MGRTIRRVGREQALREYYRAAMFDPRVFADPLVDLEYPAVSSGSRKPAEPAAVPAHSRALPRMVRIEAADEDDKSDFALAATLIVLHCAQLNFIFFFYYYFVACI